MVHRAPKLVQIQFSLQNPKNPTAKILFGEGMSIFSTIFARKWGRKYFFRLCSGLRPICGGAGQLVISARTLVRALIASIFAGVITHLICTYFDKGEIAVVEKTKQTSARARAETPIHPHDHVISGEFERMDSKNFEDSTRRFVADETRERKGETYTLRDKYYLLTQHPLEDIAVSLKVKRPHSGGKATVAVRHTQVGYYAMFLYPNRIHLVKYTKANDTYNPLAKTELSWNSPDSTLNALQIRAEGANIRVLLNGRELLAARDVEFASGNAAIWAEGPEFHFVDVVVGDG